MFAEVEDPKSLIAVLHPPPYGTELDQAPLIDGEFRVQTENAGVKFGPGRLDRGARLHPRGTSRMLALHGHVHESQGAQRLGRTLCINPGSEYTAGALSCALVTLTGDSVEFQFTTG